MGLGFPRRASGWAAALSGPVRFLLLVGAATAWPASTSSAPPAAHGPRELLPAGHWAYRDLERLWARGIIDKLDMAVRPWGRNEAARALADALDRPGTPRDDPVVERLVREFTEELHRLEPGRFPSGPSPIWTVRDDTADVRWSAGAQVMSTEARPDVLQLAPESRAFLQVRANLSPELFATTEVRVQRTGSSRNIGDSLVKNEDIYVDAGESYVSFSPASVQGVAGWIRNRWGPGTTGTLLLSDAAEPFATFRWERRVGGTLAFHALTGVLADPDHRYLAVHRLTWTPTPSLAIGLAESARYDARSLEFLYVLNLIPYTLVERISSKNRTEDPEILNRNNVMVSADVVWRVRRGMRLTAELLLDDLATESAGMPHRLGYQLGFEQWLSYLRWPVGLSAEFTKVFRYTYATFYERNYVHADRPLGYALGPDVENLDAALRVDVSADWSGWLGLQATRKGESGLGDAWIPGSPSSAWAGGTLSGTVESDVAMRLGAEFRPWPYAWSDVVVGYHWIRNADHGDGRNEGSFEMRAALSVRR